MTIRPFTRCAQDFADALDGTVAATPDLNRMLAIVGGLRAVPTPVTPPALLAQRSRVVSRAMFHAPAPIRRRLVPSFAPAVIAVLAATVGVGGMASAAARSNAGDPLYALGRALGVTRGDPVDAVVDRERDRVRAAESRLDALITAVEGNGLVDPAEVQAVLVDVDAALRLGTERLAQASHAGSARAAAVLAAAQAARLRLETARATLPALPTPKPSPSSTPTVSTPGAPGVVSTIVVPS